MVSDQVMHIDKMYNFEGLGFTLNCAQYCTCYVNFSVFVEKKNDISMPS